MTYAEGLTKEAGLSDSYYKAGVMYDALSRHIDTLVQHKMIEPAAKAMFKKAQTALEAKKFAQSHKYYSIGAKLAGLGQEGDSINKVSDIYNHLSQPMQMAKAVLINKLFGG
jgi:hypothetical protein